MELSKSEILAILTEISEIFKEILEMISEISGIFMEILKIFIEISKIIIKISEIFIEILQISEIFTETSHFTYIQHALLSLLNLKLLRGVHGKIAEKLQGNI